MSLVINYIEIENFKSYYGKNILGPFHQVCNFQKKIIILFKNLYLFLIKEFQCCNWSKWLWQIKRYRFIAFCIRISCSKNSYKKD